MTITTTTTTTTANRHILFHESNASISSDCTSNNNKPFYYQKRVSFDNITNIPTAAAFHTFTLKQSTLAFERTRRTRSFMVAIDLDKEEMRLDSIAFTLRSLVDEGDEIIVVAVYSPEIYNDISPKEKAREIMNWIVNLHKQSDNINMVVELTYGRPDITLNEMMRLYQPSMLVVGSRNKQKYKHAYSGTGIFKYRLKHAHVPIVVVRDKLPTAMIYHQSNFIKKIMLFFSRNKNK